MTNPITTAREALITCVQKFPDLLSGGRTVFARVYTFEDELPSLTESDLATPTFPDFPGIAIFPSQVVPNWYLAQQQKIAMFFDVRVWTTTWDIAKAEELVWKVRHSFWNYIQSGTMPYVQQQTSYLPVTTGPITFKRGRLGGKKNASGVKLIQTQMTVHLQARDNPLQ